MADTKEFINPFREEAARFGEYACTIVSLLPFALREDVPHLIPNTFHIPAAEEKDGFSVTYVKEAIHYVPNPMIDEGKPGANIKQITPPAAMAASLVNGYLLAVIASDADSRPGLFWLDGKYTPTDVKRHAAEPLAEARRVQRNWYVNLTRMADADWNKNKNILAVSSLQRIAAKTIGHSAEWVDYIQDNAPVLTKCPFCMVLVDPSSIICMNCKQVLDKERYAAMTVEVKK